MSRLYFRLIKSDEQLSEFSSYFKTYGNVDLPLYYYRLCDVVAAFDENQKMVGGYAIATGDAIGWVKKIAKPTAFQENIPLSKMLELNSVWLSPEIRMSQSAAAFWVQVAKDVSSRRKPYISFCCDTAKVGLLKLYSKAARGVIYEGPFTTAAPDRTFRLWWSTPLRFRLVRLYYMKDLLVRHFSERQHAAKTSS